MARDGWTVNRSRLVDSWHGYLMTLTTREDNGPANLRLEDPPAQQAIEVGGASSNQEPQDVLGRKGHLIPVDREPQDSPLLSMYGGLLPSDWEHERVVILQARAQPGGNGPDSFRSVRAARCRGCVYAALALGPLAGAARVPVSPQGDTTRTVPRAPSTSTVSPSLIVVVALWV